jgi:hypothetical protein
VPNRLPRRPRSGYDRQDLWRWHSSTNRRVARLMMPTLSSDGEA